MNWASIYASSETTRAGVGHESNAGPLRVQEWSLLYGDDSSVS